MEIWKTIEEAPRYEINNRGDIRNKKTGRILKYSNFNHRNYIELRADRNVSVQLHGKELMKRYFGV